MILWFYEGQHYGAFASTVQSEHVSLQHTECWGLQQRGCYISLLLWQDKINLKFWERMKTAWTFAGWKEMMNQKKSHPASTNRLVTRRADLTAIKTMLPFPSWGCLWLNEWWYNKGCVWLCETVTFWKIILQWGPSGDCSLGGGWQSSIAHQASLRAGAPTQVPAHVGTVMMLIIYTAFVLWVSETSGTPSEAMELCQCKTNISIRSVLNSEQIQDSCSVPGLSLYFSTL